MKKYLIIILSSALCAVSIGALSASAETEVSQETASVTPQDITAGQILDTLNSAQYAANEVEITDGQKEVVGQVGGWVSTLLSIIGGSSILAALLGRGSKSGQLIAFIRAFIDAFAFNWMNAKNGPPK